MKTLFLVRHAKASPAGLTLSDRDRPLADRGHEDARKMGRRLARHHAKPELLVSSPALRALTTARLFAEQIGCASQDIVVDDRLYASSADGLLAVVRALDDKVDRVMLFGHNPEFAELAHRLSSDIVGMPTCAVAEFHFDTKAWPDVGRIEPVRSTFDQPGH